jgi:hypothetical protein
MILKYTFILCAFGILNIYVFIYIVSQTLNNLTVTKKYMHRVLGRKSTIFCSYLESLSPVVVYHLPITVSIFVITHRLYVALVDYISP